MIRSLLYFFLFAGYQAIAQSVEISTKDKTTPASGEDRYRPFLEDKGSWLEMNAKGRTGASLPVGRPSLLILDSKPLIQSFSGGDNYVQLKGTDAYFVYDPAATDAPDGYFVLPAPGKNKGSSKAGRWFLANRTEINVLDFGAKGDFDGQNAQTCTNNTIPFQRALDAAQKATDPVKYVMQTPYKRRFAVVRIPNGNYALRDAVWIRGAVCIEMEPVGSYGGTRLIQLSQGKHLFRLGGDPDGASSNAISIRGGILRASAATLTPGTALIFGGNSNAQGDGNHNSLYIENVWFQTPEDYGIHLQRGGDVVINRCTFDVAAFHALRLGAANTPVETVAITNNIFFDVQAGAIDLVHAKGIQIADNRVIGIVNRRMPYFVKDQGAVKATSIALHNNYLSFVNIVLDASSGGNYSLTNNVGDEFKGPSIILGNNATYDGILISGNRFEGNYSGQIPNTTIPNAPIWCPAAITNSRFDGNIFKNTGKTGLVGLHANDKRNRRFSYKNNSFIGFERPFLVAGSSAEGRDAEKTVSISNAGVLDVTQDDAEFYRLNTTNASTALTNLDQAYIGQTVNLTFGSNRLVKHSNRLLLNGNQDFTARIGNTLTLKRDHEKWIEISRTSGSNSSSYPEVTQAQRLAMPKPNPGQHVYQTDQKEGVWVYKSSGWVFAY